MMNVIENIFVIGCRIGVDFINGSYFTRINNSTITGCREIGLSEKGSKLVINNVDVEATGVLGDDGFFSGNAIIAGYSTLSNIHIEGAKNALILNTGSVVCENFSASRCINVIYSDDISISSICMYNSVFVDTRDYDLDIGQNTKVINKHALYLEAGGAGRDVKIKEINRSIIEESLAYEDGVGSFLKFKSKKIKFNEYYLKSYYRYSQNIDLGNIPSKSYKAFDVTIDKNILNPYGLTVVDTIFINQEIPHGVFLQSKVKTSSLDTYTLVVYNLTDIDIDLGEKTISSIVNNVE